MPTFNRSRYIGETIQSLIRQDWEDFEFLIRDDGSGDDGTAEAVAAFASNDPRVRYHRNARRLGMPGNLNGGILDSRGEFIAVCHDHDIYKPNFLSTMMRILLRNPTAYFVHCAIDMISEDGGFIRTLAGDWPELSPGRRWLEFMLSGANSPVCALTLVRREAHERLGLYDPRFGFVSDVEMWMRLSLNGDVAYAREPLIRVREREKDHFAVENSFALCSAIAQIHRKYIPYIDALPRRLNRRFRIELRLVHQFFVAKAVSIRRAFLSRNRHG